MRWWRLICGSNILRTFNKLSLLSQIFPNEGLATVIPIRRSRSSEWIKWIIQIGPSWDRTNNPQIRNLVLYPIELWARKHETFRVTWGTTAKCNCLLTATRQKKRSLLFEILHLLNLKLQSHPINFLLCTPSSFYLRGKFGRQHFRHNVTSMNLKCLL